MYERLKKRHTGVMDNNSEEELRKELEATKIRLYDEQLAREKERIIADSKVYARENKASEHTAQIVFFGAIALIFLMAIISNTRG